MWLSYFVAIREISTMRPVSLLICVSVMFLVVGVTAKEPSGPVPISIRLDRSSHSGLAIEVNSTSVSTSTLMSALGHLLQQRGRSTPVLVFATETVTIEDLQYIRAIAGKVGLSSIRFFSLDRTRDLAAEIRMEMLGVPVSDVLAGVSEN